MKQRALLDTIAVIFVAAPFAGASSAQVAQIRPHRKVEPIRVFKVKWTGGFWKQRFDICRENMIPSM